MSSPKFLLPHYLRLTGYALAIVCLLPVFSNLYAQNEEDSPLQLAMEELNRNFRVLKRQVQTESKKEDNLNIVQEMQTLAKAAAKEEPKGIEEIPANQKVQFLQDYSSAIDDLISALEQLAAAIEKDEIDKAEQLLQEINDLKSSGHDRFKKE